MALILDTFVNDLIDIFSAMDNIMDGTGDEYQAVEMAAAIRRYILTGKVTTSDAGIIGESSYSGTGTGSMTINRDSLGRDLHATFIAQNSNNQLAARMAADIDRACSAADTVTTENSSGSGIGSFARDKTQIENVLRSCFSAMNGMMTGGGNEFYARQLGAAITDYLKAGAITVRLLPPFSSGSGRGGIQ